MIMVNVKKCVRKDEATLVDITGIEPPDTIHL
jgi:hypothetical protein